MQGFATTLAVILAVGDNRALVPVSPVRLDYDAAEHSDQGEVHDSFGKLYDTLDALGLIESTVPRNGASPFTELILTGEIMLSSPSGWTPPEAGDTVEIPVSLLKGFATAMTDGAELISRLSTDGYAEHSQSVAV